MATSQSQSSLPPIDGHHSFSNQPPLPHVSDTGFPILAFAILGITATAFLLVSYYVFVTKCCFRWHLADPLGRFSIRRAQPNDDGPLTFYSPSSWQTRGLDELLIREIPTFQYGKPEKGGFTGPTKCVVCLNEFQDREILRVLPKCSHAFHLDCIDVWLLGNSNCPLCRSAISGRNRYRPRPEWIVAPTTSPQDPLGDDEFVEIVISGRDESETGAAREDSRRFPAQSRSHSSRKFEHKILKSNKTRKFSIMGDEEIDIGAKDDDDQFRVQPIRRSFSMDSAADRHVYLSVQETVRRNRSSEEEEESGSRSRRSIFSFGHGRGSRNALHPVE